MLSHSLHLILYLLHLPPIFSLQDAQSLSQMHIAPDIHDFHIHIALSLSLIHISTPRILSLEEALDFIDTDELLEVTPQSLRIRKKILDSKIDVYKRQVVVLLSVVVLFAASSFVLLPQPVVEQSTPTHSIHTVSYTHLIKTAASSVLISLEL